MDKRILTELRIVADKLPPLHYKVLETQKISGEDALLAGTTEVDGQAIDPEKEYQFKAPAFYPVNHYRRMKKIYQKYMRESNEKAFLEVTKYVNSCFAAAKKLMAQ